MPQFLATLVFLAGIIALFALDRDRGSRTSPALWLAGIRPELGGSRNVTLWLSGATLHYGYLETYLDSVPARRGRDAAVSTAGAAATGGGPDGAASEADLDPRPLQPAAYPSLSRDGGLRPPVPIPELTRSLLNGDYGGVTSQIVSLAGSPGDHRSVNA